MCLMGGYPHLCTGLHHSRCGGSSKSCRGSTADLFRQNTVLFTGQVKRRLAIQFIVTLFWQSHAAFQVCMHGWEGVQDEPVN